MDAMEPREHAISILDEVLGGRITSVGALRKVWPETGPDLLLRRARQEAEHYLVTGGVVERRIVRLMREYLTTGGSPTDLDRAYDEAIREALDDRPPQP